MDSASNKGLVASIKGLLWRSTHCRDSERANNLPVFVLFSFCLLAIATSASSNTPEIEKILALQADADYGEYLAGECFTCHKVSGESKGVPRIAGTSAQHIVTQLLAFKSGTRINQVMQGVAGSLGPEEIASLALFFSSLDSN